MLRLSRPALVLAAVAVLATLHFLFSSPPAKPEEPKSRSSSRQISRDREPFVAAPPKYRGRARVASEDKAPIQEDGLDIDKRGLTTYIQGKNSKHPIEVLIERGRRLAAAQEAQIREVASLEDSAEDYQKFFGLKPPKGYDAWFRFAKSIRFSPVTSLYPFVHKPFDAHLAIPAIVLRDRVGELREKEGFFTFTFVENGKGDKGTACKKDEEWFPPDWHERGRGRVLVGGTGAWSWRCNNTLNLILPILPSMPDAMFRAKPPLEVAFSLADGPRSMIHESFQRRSEAIGRSLKTWPKGQLHKAEQALRWTWGWQWACPEGAPLKESNTDIVLNDLIGYSSDQTVLAKPAAERTFIADFDKASDFCCNPDLMHYHHLLLSDASVAAGSLYPNVASCRSAHNADIVGVPLDGVHETVDLIPWDDKTLKKAFWRGSATGLHHSKNSLWRQSQRERLHWFSNNKSEETISLLVDKGQQGGLGYEEWKVKDLNEIWLDVGLSGSPNQCDVADGSCDDMAREIDFLGRVRKEDATRFKFVIDVDGNGWSSRFRRLLSANNVVLKSTLYPEWFSGMLIPWYHYVPMKLDYTDMYDILAFFMGSPDGSTPGRDDLAREIAANGQKFVEERWRMEDMRAYTYLLLLEFWRMMADDREKASYHMET